MQNHCYSNEWYITEFINIPANPEISNTEALGSTSWEVLGTLFQTGALAHLSLWNRGAPWCTLTISVSCNTGPDTDREPYREAKSLGERQDRA